MTEELKKMAEFNKSVENRVLSKANQAAKNLEAAFSNFDKGIFYSLCKGTGGASQEPFQAHRI